MSGSEKEALVDFLTTKYKSMCFPISRGTKIDSAISIIATLRGGDYTKKLKVRQLFVVADKLYRQYMGSIKNKEGK